MALLAFTSGPLAPFSAFLACCTEAATLTSIAAKSWFLGDALVDTFDATLMARGQENLVAQGREVKKGKGDVFWKLGKLAKRPFAGWTPTALVRGKGEGPAGLGRYFQLKGWGAREKEEHVKSRRGAYTSLGIASVLLEMVPVVNIIFAFTNTVGAALWAADMEKGHAQQEGGSGRGLRSRDKKAQ
ncbi:uncharacterized protein KY384_001213 [Bacidia gigantensis]|uniref:uncharacterized protein n=1 Tax=Bacidia gigantensis TaxID=2732470 RepID=UPI001D04E9A2|nr:uncharacterized protein KY384_001213 [Bacidia gigantensis]KAG8534368.1 hypothetical protein KY384_001213 [Bacidia gigantensis]